MNTGVTRKDESGCVPGKVVGLREGWRVGGEDKEVTGSWQIVRDSEIVARFGILAWIIRGCWSIINSAEARNGTPDL